LSDNCAVKFEFTGTVEIPREEIDEFIDALVNRHFDFFRFLGDNSATIQPVGVLAGLVKEYVKEWHGNEQ
jgi:hypothetical protein